MELAMKLHKILEEINKIENITEREAVYSDTLKKISYNYPGDILLDLQGTPETDKLVNKILKKRECKTDYKPYDLILTERFFAKDLEQMFKDGILKEKPSKQLGESVQVYGHLITSIIAILNTHWNNRNLPKGIEVFESSEGLRDSIKIIADWTDFTKRFTPSEKRDLILKRDKLTKHIIFITNTKGQMVWKEFRLLDYSFEGTMAKATNINLKGLSENMTQIGKIEILVNREAFEVIKDYYDRTKKRIGKKASKIISHVSFEIRETFETHKDSLTHEWGKRSLLNYRETLFFNEQPNRIFEIIESMTYNDRYRIALEKIIDILETGRQNRKKNTIDFDDKIYNLIFKDKHAGDHVRFAFIVYIYNTVLQNTKDFKELRLKTESRYVKKGDRKRMSKRFLIGFIAEPKSLQ